MRPTSAPCMPLAPRQESRRDGNHDNRVPVNGSVVECLEARVEGSRKKMPLKVSDPVLSALLVVFVVSFSLSCGSVFKVL